MDLELKLGYQLPGSFKEFIIRCNGFGIMSDHVYGIYTGSKWSKVEKAMDLYENYLWEKDESGNPIWPHLLPISPDGFGNHYCLDLKTLTEDKTECKVVFWQHDYEFSEDDPPDVETNSFLEFVWNLLMEIKGMINYDGTDK